MARKAVNTLQRHKQQRGIYNNKQEINQEMFRTLGLVDMNGNLQGPIILVPNLIQNEQDGLQDSN